MATDCAMRNQETKLMKAVHDQKTNLMKAVPRQKGRRFSLSSLGKKKGGAIPPSWKGIPPSQPVYDQETRLMKAMRPQQRRPQQERRCPLSSLGRTIHPTHVRQL